MYMRLWSSLFLKTQKNSVKKTVPAKLTFLIDFFMSRFWTLRNKQCFGKNEKFLRPHYVLQNIKPYELGLFSRTLSFFYNSLVEEVDKDSVGALARDLTNVAVRKQTRQQVKNFLKPTANLVVKGPIGIVSGAYFQVQ